MAEAKELSIDQSGGSVEVQIRIPGRGIDRRAHFEGAGARELARQWAASIDRDLGDRQYWSAIDVGTRPTPKEAAPEVFGPTIVPPGTDPDARPATQQRRAGRDSATAGPLEPSAAERAAATKEAAATPTGPPQVSRAVFSDEEGATITADPQRVERYRESLQSGIDPELAEQRYLWRQDHTVEKELAFRFFSIAAISLPGIVVGEVAAVAGVGGLAGSVLSTTVDIAWNQTLRAHEGLPSMTAREVGVQAAQGVGPQLALSVVARALKLMPTFKGTKPRAPRTPSTRFYSKVRDIINNTPNHPLKKLINPRTGDFWAKHHGADVPAVQMGHGTTYSSGAAERVFLEDADFNQMTNWSGESGGRAVFVKPCIEIGGVPVDLKSAVMWERLELIPAGTVANSIPSLGWIP